MSALAAVEIGDSLQQGLNSFFGFLPNLLGFIIILAIGYIVAKVVKGVITKALQKVGVDRALHSGAAGQHVNKVAPDLKPSSIIGTIAFWFIFLGAIGIAVSALKIPALENFIGSVAAYLPNVLAAILIFLVASVVSAAVGGLVMRTMGETPTGKIVATVAPILIMGIATFMILQQLQIAPEIVQITYTALIGSIALGLALAFGLGGREVAGRMLEDAYQRGRQNADQVKQDMQVGKERAKQDAQNVADKAGSGSSEQPTRVIGGDGATAASTQPISSGSGPVSGDATTRRFS